MNNQTHDNNQDCTRPPHPVTDKHVAEDDTAKRVVNVIPGPPGLPGCNTFATIRQPPLEKRLNMVANHGTNAVGCPNKPTHERVVVIKQPKAVADVGKKISLQIDCGNTDQRCQVIWCQSFIGT